MHIKSKIRFNSWGDKLWRPRHKLHRLVIDAGAVVTETINESEIWKKKERRRRKTDYQNP
jgi:hypothetical protein